MRNKKFYTKATSRSKTGFPGVYKTGGNNKGDFYQARIVVDKKELYLGVFKTIEQALAVRKEAEEKYYGGNPYESVC